MTTCAHCRYYPARPERSGYCSWDCFEHDYEVPAPSADGRRDRPLAWPADILSTDALGCTDAVGAGTGY